MPPSGEPNRAHGGLRASRARGTAVRGGQLSPRWGGGAARALGEQQFKPLAAALAERGDLELAVEFAITQAGERLVQQRLTRVTVRHRSQPPLRAHAAESAK